MLENLDKLPADPLLGLIEAFAADSNPDKIDLGVGVYQDSMGRTPVMAAVLAAEARLRETEGTKSYMPPAGDANFNGAVQTLLLGADHVAMSDKRVGSVQTPGGCGALSIGAELIRRGNAGSRVWVSDPTWPNHLPLLGSVGLQVESYPYYDFTTHGLDFAAMISALAQTAVGDVVLVHGCCHNPSGADLTFSQWQALTDLALEKGFTPLVDVAYQGLAAGLEEDVAGLRYMAARVPEMLIASSCSKNFGLYRERTGALIVIAETKSAKESAISQVLNAARQTYGMPPSHGALIAGMILSDAGLRKSWEHELDGMRRRIASMRAMLVERMSVSNDRFQFINGEFGMFSFIGIPPDRVARLRDEFGIYMADSTRINVAGLNEQNVDYFAAAVLKVL